MNQVSHCWRKKEGRKAKIKTTPVMFNGDSKYQYELSGI